MKRFKLLLFMIFAPGISGAEAPDPSNGKKLFNESRCLTCHSTELFTKEDRIVKSLPQLEKQVRQCDARLSTNWFDDQILDVVAYLNRDYYKFKESNKSHTEN